MGAKLTYAMLLKYAREMDECFPGQERLAKDMGCALRSVVRYIAELEEVSLISIKRRGQGRPNLYTIHRKRRFGKSPNNCQGRSANLACLVVPHLHF